MGIMTREIKHYYLVDYENVNLNGMRGVELAETSARIQIFLSQAAHTATTELKDDILLAKAEIDTIYCNANSKNAMDFQIAAYFGEVLVRPQTRRISIISNDKGYRSLFDYSRKVRKSVKVFQAASILEAYAACMGDYDRVEYIASKNKSADFKQVMEELQKKQDFEAELLRKVGEDKLPEVRAMIYQKEIAPKELYTGLLHILGRSGGIETYHFLKEMQGWR